MSVREIQGHLLELYGTQVSPDLISTITDEVMEEVVQWQQRPLEPMYPIVYFDALRLKIRDEGTVKNKAVYLVLGIRANGRKEVLGLWIEQTEGAKFCKRPTLHLSFDDRCRQTRISLNLEDLLSAPPPSSVPRRLRRPAAPSAAPRRPSAAARSRAPASARRPALPAPAHRVPA